MDTPAMDSIPIAILAHDSAVDLSGMLACYDIEIDTSDPREVQNLLTKNFNLRIGIADEVPSDLFLKLRDSVMSLPKIPRSEPWENAERILSKFTNDRIGKAIISVVDRLATLIFCEKAEDAHVARTAPSASQQNVAKSRRFGTQAKPRP